MNVVDAVIREVIALLAALFPSAVSSQPPAVKLKAPPVAPKAPDAPAKVLGPLRTISAPAAPEDPPRGWFGKLVAHGGICLAYEIAYHRAHKHLLPMLAASWSGVHNRVDLDWSRSTLMTLRFSEWQCPVFDWQTPDFFGRRFGPTHTEWEGDLNAIGYGDRPMAGWQPDTWLRGTIQRKSGGPIAEIGAAPADNVIAWYDRLAELDHHGHDREWLMGRVALAPYRGKKIAIPSYWNTDARRGDWLARMGHWYATAQWLVWACECLRLHCNAGKGTGADPDWVAHCAAWGIGVYVGGSHRETYYTHALDSGSPEGKACRSDLPRSEWLKVRARVMQHTPVPGSVGTLGTQIREPGHPRTLCDIPASAGSAVPPIVIADGGWCWAAASHWAAGTHLHNVWTDHALPAWNAVIGAAASFFGSAQALAAMSAVQAAFSVTSSAMAMSAGLANGKLPEAGDVVQIFGKVIALVGHAGGAGLKVPGDDLWDRLKSSTAKLDVFSGELSADAVIAARQVQTRMVELRDLLNWGYLDSAFGEIVSEG